MNSIKYSNLINLIKKHVCDEWCPQIAKYKKEKEFMQRDIVEHLRFYKSEMLYRFGSIGKIRVNVNGKSYVVDFTKDNIYIDTEQYFIPYDRPADLIGEGGELNVLYFPHEATLYKNFTNNYEDIKIILKTIDRYLTDQRQQKVRNPWNVEQKIKEVFDYIMNARNVYKSELNYISSIYDSYLFLNSSNISDYNGNCYEQFEFDVIGAYFSDDFLKFCNDILVLNKNLYDRNEDNYLYAKFSYKQSRPSYDNEIYDELRRFTSFLKYFDINKKILPIINSEEKAKYYFDMFSYDLYPHRQRREIKKLLRKLDPKLLNLVKAKLRQNDYNYEKFKNSLYFNFSETDAIKLFYNPKIFYVPLPEDLSIRKYKVSIYVANSMFSTGDIKYREIDIQNIDDVKNINSEDVLSYIAIKFCLDDPYNNDRKFTFSVSLDDYLSYLFKLNGVSDISRFFYCSDYDYVYNINICTSQGYDFKEMKSLRKDLLSFVAVNKSRLLYFILNEMENHVNIGKIHTEFNIDETHTKLSDVFLVTCAEDYFDDCIQKM